MAGKWGQYIVFMLSRSSDIFSNYILSPVISGSVSAERFEIRNPLVQRTGDVAVLTFNFVSFGGNENEFRWNCTEVYRRDAEGWRIIQTHWSFTNPEN